MIVEVVGYLDYNEKMVEELIGLDYVGVAGYEECIEVTWNSDKVDFVKLAETLQIKLKEICRVDKIIMYLT